MSPVDQHLHRAHSWLTMHWQAQSQEGLRLERYILDAFEQRIWQVALKSTYEEEIAPGVAEWQFVPQLQRSSLCLPAN
jgi:hypothetical protein